MACGFKPPGNVAEDQEQEVGVQYLYSAPGPGASELVTEVAGHATDGKSNQTLKETNGDK